MLLLLYHCRINGSEDVILTFLKRPETRHQGKLPRNPMKTRNQGPGQGRGQKTGGERPQNIGKAGVLPMLSCGISLTTWQPAADHSQALG